MANEVNRKGVKPLKGKPLINLTGERFGRLVVLEQAESVKGRIAWLCQCDCGNTKIATSQVLRKGLTTSCGCYKSEVARKRATKHLLCDSSLYDSYHNMIKRCTNENCDHYKWYGGEGKTVCDEWLGENGFLVFSEWALSHGFKEHLQIDRIDNSKGYSPDNCRWVTNKENSRNRRSNHLVTIDGETKTLIEWCETYGISDQVVRARISSLGWDDIKAITTPKLRNGKEK